MGWMFVSIALCVAIITWYVRMNKRADEKFEKDRIAKIEKARIEREKDALACKVQKLRTEIESKTMSNYDLASRIKHFYARRLSRFDLNAEINAHLSSAESSLTEVQKLLQELDRVYSCCDEKAHTCLEAVKTDLFRTRRLVEKFRSYDNAVCSLPKSVMMESGNYGKQNKAFSESILTMTREDSARFIRHCETVLSEGQLDKIFEIDIEKVLRHVWFFATEKNFSASDYNRAKDVFLKIGQKAHVDIYLADFYSKKKMGSEKVLHDDVRKLLEKDFSSDFFTNVASGLMWMNAYQQEHAVLEHMLAKGMEMTPKAQERLYSLSTSGGKAPESFSVESSDDSLYFDVSSLTWRDAEYTGFYDTLAFQDKLLTYSLAIRDEDKELLVAQGITAPNIDTLLEKLNETLVEEFGPTVTAKSVHCIALSGSSEEPMDGILVSTTECKHMGVFLHIARIGKKLIIKFYTLFIPIGTDLTVQRQQSMSMSKKLSPTVTMWESSLKDTMLMAVQQLLNSDMPVIPAGKGEEHVGPASEPVYF